MHAVIHAADIQDRDGGILVMASLFWLYPFLLKLYANSGYQGPQFQAGLCRVMKQVSVEIVKRSDTAKAFVVLPKRWIVERTIAWLNRCRRLAKDGRGACGFRIASGPRPSQWRKSGQNLRTHWYYPSSGSRIRISMRRFSPASGSALFLRSLLRVAFQCEEPAFARLASQQHVIGHRGAIDRETPVAIAVFRIGAAVCVSPDDYSARIFVDDTSQSFQEKYERRRRHWPRKS